MEMRRRGFLLGAAAGACGALGERALPNGRLGEATLPGREAPARAAIAPPGSDNGKRLTANDIHMSVAEAAALLASEDADAQLIALANARAVEVGTGASLEVEVADRSALVAEPGEYPVTFKTNPELTVTAYVEDGGSQPGGDAGGDAGEAAAADRRAAESARGGIAETGDSASWMLGVALVMAIASIGALSLGIRSRRGAIG